MNLKVCFFWAIYKYLFGLVLMSCKVNFHVVYTISFAEFSVSARCIFLLVRSFIDPTFCGIFVCGPCSFNVNLLL